MFATVTKYGSRAPRRVHDVKIFLVLLHRRDQRFGRYLQKAWLETPGERARPLDQAAHLVEQFVIDHRIATERGCLRAHLLGNDRAPLAVIGDHVPAVAQCALVVAGSSQRDACAAVYTVPARLAPARDSQDLARNHAITVQQHDPVHGSHELHATRSPAHAFGDWQSGERRLDLRRQQGSRSLTRDVLAPCQPLATLAADAQQRVDADTAAARKTECRSTWLAVGVECGCHGRAELLCHGIRLGRGDVLDVYREPARGGVPAGCAVCDALFVEACNERVRERLRQRAQALRREFLGTDLDQQGGGVHRVVSPAASSSARNSGAASGKPSALRISW